MKINYRFFSLSSPLSKFGASPKTGGEETLMTRNRSWRRKLAWKIILFLRRMLLSFSLLLFSIRHSLSLTRTHTLSASFYLKESHRHHHLYFLCLRFSSGSKKKNLGKRPLSSISPSLSFLPHLAGRGSCNYSRIFLPSSAATLFSWDSAAAAAHQTRHARN